MMQGARSKRMGKRESLGETKERANQAMWLGVLIGVCVGIGVVPLTHSATNLPTELTRTPDLKRLNEVSITNEHYRDPFWPPDYVPPARRPDTNTPEQATNTVEEAETDKTPEGNGDTDMEEAEQQRAIHFEDLTSEQRSTLRKQLRLDGFMQIGRRRAAILNDRTVFKGDELTINLEGSELKCRVDRIEADRIFLAPTEENAQDRSLDSETP